MTSDLLAKATKALSESGHEQQGGRFTRERLMGSLHERRQRSKSRFFVFLPLAALFVGSTAFAAATGDLSRIVQSALDAVGMTTPAEPVPATRPATNPALPVKPPNAGRASAAAPALSVAEVDPAPSPDAPSTHRDAEPVALAAPLMRKPRAPEAERELPGVPQDAVDDAHAKYKAAHLAQFKRNDCATALAGYAEYLTLQPAGRFAVDARYNRVLCLVRLGQTSEARSDLTRFANGAYGSYRQEDAERLLAALDEAN